MKNFSLLLLIFLMCALAAATAGGGLAGDIVKMRRIATNHRTQANDGIVALLAGEFGGYQRDLPRSWGLYYLDVLHARARPRQRV